VRQVGGNTGGVDDIEEGELVDEGRDLAEEGQRLASVSYRGTHIVAEQ
jgi:hypothetical protein